MNKTIRIIKSPILAHKDDKNRRVTIYSAHINPVRNVLASAGIDTKIRLWNLSSEISLLSTLTLHNGAVICVRFSSDGKLLASGSDGDNVIIIWEPQLMNDFNGKVFGSSEVNKESWKCRIRLNKHHSDVVDLAWSPNGRYLASCALDGKVLIWDTEIWDCVKSLNGHTNFVKGVQWDPTSQYLSSASDDGSLILWECANGAFNNVKSIRGPFKKSFGSVFFRRGSWSPDGANLCAVHACDESGLVSTVSILKREIADELQYVWEEEASLVGHRFACECAAYNPQMFVKNGDEPYTLLAVGSRNGSVSFWQSNRSRPVLVIEKLFDGFGIFDIGWSNDGTLLYAVCSEGLVALVSMCPSESQKTSLAGVQLLLDSAEDPTHKSTRIKSQVSKRIMLLDPPSSGVVTPFGKIVDRLAVVKLLQKFGYVQEQTQYNTSGNSQGQVGLLHKIKPAEQPLLQLHPQLLVNGNKRKLVEDTDSEMAEAKVVSVPVEQVQLPSKPLNTRLSMLMEPTGESGNFQSYNPVSQAMKSNSQASNTLMEQRVSVRKDGKRRVQPVTLTNPSRNESLYGQGQELNVTNNGISMGRTSVIKRIVADLPIKLPFDPLKPLLVLEIEGQDGNLVRITVEQQALRDISKLSYRAQTKAQSWIAHVPAPACLLCSTDSGIFAFLEDSSVYYWSHGGRKLLPVLKTDSPVVKCEHVSSYWSVITRRGSLWLWSFNGTAIIQGASLAHLLLSSDGKDTKIISYVQISNNGTVFICLNDYNLYAYDRDMASWITVKENEQFDRIAFKQMPCFNEASQPLTMSYVQSFFKDVKSQYFRSNDIRVSITLAHLEEKMAVSVLINDAESYKKVLVEYCNLLGSIGEQAVSRGSELCRELFDSSSTSKIVDMLQMEAVDIFGHICPLMAVNVRLQDMLAGYKRMFDQQSSTSGSYKTTLDM